MTTTPEPTGLEQEVCGCGNIFDPEDGCPHGVQILCPECMTSCGECRQDAKDDGSLRAIGL